jgi:hypothetical protein
MPFYRRRWDERRGDRYDDWSAAVYYFWVQESSSRPKAAWSIAQQLSFKIG